MLDYYECTSNRLRYSKVSDWKTLQTFRKCSHICKMMWLQNFQSQFPLSLSLTIKQQETPWCIFVAFNRAEIEVTAFLLIGDLLVSEIFFRRNALWRKQINKRKLNCTHTVFCFRKSRAYYFLKTMLHVTLCFNAGSFIDRHIFVQKKILLHLYHCV